MIFVNYISSFVRVSYNGVIFDVESTGPYEVDILSISIAGMLNRVVWERRILNEIIEIKFNYFLIGY